jgi:hypothetical protein
VVFLAMSMRVTAQTTKVLDADNVVGYYRVVLLPSNGFSMVAISLEALDSTNQTVEGMLGIQLVGGERPELADRLYLFDTASQTFKVFARNTSDGGVHRVTDWSGVSTNPVLPVGQAFWIQSGASALSNRDVTIVGAVVSVMTQQTAIVRGLQIIGYPFSTDADMRTWGLTNGTAGRQPALSDMVIKWNGQRYESFVLNSNRQWMPLFPTTATTRVSLGCGFWYRARTNFVWTETNTYYGNLLTPPGLQKLN